MINWVVGLVFYSVGMTMSSKKNGAKKEMSLLDNSCNNCCHCPLTSKQSSGGRSVKLQLFIIWTDKRHNTNIRDTEGQTYKSEPASNLTKNNQKEKPKYTGGYCRSVLQHDGVVSCVVEQNCRFLFLTALLIVVCLQWMAAKGRGKNPELQVTDRGSDTACMQTGRGRKNITSARGAKKERKKNPTSTLFKSQRQTAANKFGSAIFYFFGAAKLRGESWDVYIRRGNEVYRALLDSAIAN